MEIAPIPKVNYNFYLYVNLNIFLLIDNANCSMLIYTELK